MTNYREKFETLCAAMEANRRKNAVNYNIFASTIECPDGRSTVYATGNGSDNGNEYVVVNFKFNCESRTVLRIIGDWEFSMMQDIGRLLKTLPGTLKGNVELHSDQWRGMFQSLYVSAQSNDRYSLYFGGSGDMPPTVNYVNFDDYGIIVGSLNNGISVGISNIPLATFSFDAHDLKRIGEALCCKKRWPAFFAQGGRAWTSPRSGHQSADCIIHQYVKDHNEYGFVKDDLRHIVYAAALLDTIYYML